MDSHLKSLHAAEPTLINKQCLDDFVLELGTAFLRGLWKAYLQQINDSAAFLSTEFDRAAVAAFRRLLYGLSPPSEHLHELATLDDESLLAYVDSKVSRWNIGNVNLRKYATWDDLVKVILDDRFDNVTIFIAQAWELWRPRVADLSPGLIASVKDIHAEYIAWLTRHPDELDNIAWEAFEKLVAEIFASRGFSVDLTGRVRNQSADLLAIRTDEFGVETKYLIECKRYSRTRRIGLDIVNAVIGAARRGNVDHAFLVTSSVFTEDVLRGANDLREVRLHLRDGDDVVQWLDDYAFRSDGGLWLARDWRTGI